MTLPANIRVQTPVPFPALVTGSGVITVTKVNGVWTVGFNISNLNAQVPPLLNYATDYILVWDSVAQSFFRMTLSGLMNLTRTQRNVTGSGAIAVLSTDMIINLSISGAATISLPAYGSRNGNPITIKDAAGTLSGTVTVTITPGDATTIDGQANFVMNLPRQGITLNPYTDGVNTGWFMT